MEIHQREKTIWILGMTKYKNSRTGKSIVCDDSNFMTQGGEGSIYVVDDKIAKICEPGKMIPESKFKELNALDHPRIIKPEDVLTHNKKPVGYTMKMVPGNAVSLKRMITKAFRQREGVTHQQMQDLVKKVMEGINYIHSHPGYLQVDGNERNYMVTEKFDEIYFIDVNSYQTPNHSADAIMPSIRDYHCAQDSTGRHQWSQETDWYSFAIISFWMFTAIHPFKGMHPSFPNKKTFMMDQMLACKSVLDPETKYPLGAVYHPFEDVIPGGLDGAFMQWYRAVFVNNKRIPPPQDFQAVVKFVASVKEISGSNNFEIIELLNLDSEITGFFSKNSNEFTVTRDHVYLNKEKQVRPKGKFRVGFTPSGTPIGGNLQNGFLRLQNLKSKENLEVEATGSNLTSYDGTLYLLGQKDIFEIRFLEMGDTIVASTNSVASVMPNATELFQGVAVQNMMGVYFASMFPKEGHHFQTKIPELQKCDIVDAKYENNVLMVAGIDKETGQYDRFIFRFSKDRDEYDVRIVENILFTGLNFTVLPKGVCVCLTEQERIEIFSNQKDSSAVKSIQDPAISTDMRLCHNGNQVRFAQGSKLYSMSVK